MAITTIANPFCTAKEIFKQFNASKSKLIVTQSQYVDKLRETGDNSVVFDEDFSVVTIDNPPDGCLHFSVLSEVNEKEAPVVGIDPDDAVALPVSSGTTGLPKGVILTHKSLITIDGKNLNLYLKPNNVVFCVLPLFHIYSLNSVLMCSLRAGAGVLLMQIFEIGLLLELIQRHKVSILALAKNPMVDNFDLISIRMVLSGATLLGKELEAALLSRVPQAVFGLIPSF